jgi:cytidyltransferase-like protein
VTDRLVLTLGTFDLLHYGHVAFLRECAKLGDRLVVGVNTDRFVREFKPAPVMDVDERIHGIELLGYETRLNDSAGRELIRSVRPQVLAEGTDWAPGRGKDWLAQIGCTQDWLDEQHIIVAWVPYVQYRPISTTEIRRRVLEAHDG